VNNLKTIGRFAELVGDWKFYIKRDGLWSSLPEIGLDLVRLPYRHLRFVILERSLLEPLPKLSPKISVEIRPVEHADLAQIRNIDRPSEGKLCEHRLENGHRGLVALYEEQIIGYAWGCAEINPQLERVPIKLEPGDVLCTDVFVQPKFRGQGIQTVLSLERFQLFRDLGFQRAVCYIETTNAPSLSVWQRKLGARIIGSINFVRIGAWYRVRCN